ncbi:ROK family protein [Streptomyces sp. NBC_01014]|uniref:ROK family protein n=1 Tax=Streptomyces sp. NBC_01014 TaxID=2903719 RepID=UPI00386C3945
MTSRRPARPAGLSASWIPALDVGGTHVTAGMVDLTTGQVRTTDASRRPVPPNGSAEQIVDAIAEGALGLGAGPGRSWAIAMPGPFDYERGIAHFHGVGKFQSLYGLDLRAELMAALPRPSAITFVNDADAFLLGEHWVGAARGHERAVGITLGSGVGSSFLAEGAVVDQGPTVPPQGRVDLLTYRGRPLEDAVSRRAIRAAYARASGLADVPLADVKEIADRARAGDLVARRILTRSMSVLGRAIAPWLARFRATVLVVGGSITGSWDLIAPPLRTVIGVPRPLRSTGFVLLPAARPVQAPLLGAALCLAAEATPPHLARRLRR